MKPTPLILALLPALAVAPAHAATFVVTKTADTLDGACDADCSLREAVVAANAAPGADVIQIPAGVYVLTRPGAKEQLSRTGDLDIWDSVTLAGAGRSETILDGGQLDRVLHVLEPPAPAQAGYRVEVRDLTIRNGKTDEAGGGALNYSRGVLSLAGVTLTQNAGSTGGGVATVLSGKLELRDCVVASNVASIGGGGVASGAVTYGGEIEIRDSIVRLNGANGPGGGVLGRGPFLMERSVVAQNFTLLFGTGGGVHLWNPRAVLRNVTLSGNAAIQGGGLWAQGTAEPELSGAAEPGVLLENVTIANNNALGGGTALAAAAAAELRVRGAILRGDCALGDGASIASLGGNLSLDATCGLDQPSDQAGVDPGLEPLADNGGGTLTHALSPTSPARGAADACPATDQRAMARGAVCDSGAFEADAGPSCPDADHDGFSPAGGACGPADCDDANPYAFPGAEETCNGADDDCDGAADEGLQVDADGDGYTACGEDCDDSASLVHPGAEEVCNGRDDNCDGERDEGFPDEDGDGWAACAAIRVDCDDADPTIHRGAVEQCDDVDHNCDGRTDDRVWYVTPPGECAAGEGACRVVMNWRCVGDDPGRADFYCPAVARDPEPEARCNEIDDDCDGAVDEGFPASDKEDADGDGVTLCEGDCDDHDSNVNPTEAEVCNGVDDDCNGSVDAIDDGDDDGYGMCEAEDCRPDDPQINPGRPDVPDNDVDDDCDMIVDGRATLRFMLDSRLADGTSRFGTLARPGGDVNADGVGDLLVAADGPSAAEPPTVYVFSGSDGDEILSVPSRPEGFHEIDSLTALGDVNADGFGDFAVGSSTESAAIVVYSGGDEHVIRQWEGDDATPSWLRVAQLANAGDLDGDGADDLAALVEGADRTSILLLSVGTGHTLASLGEPEGLPPYAFWPGYDVPNLVAGRDLTGDGVPDIVAAGDFRTFVFSGKTGALSAEWPLFVAPLDLIEDIDGDGLADVAAAFTASPGGGFSGAALLSGADGAPIRSLGGPGSFIAGALGPDLDGDGAPDLLLASAGALSPWRPGSFRNVVTAVSGADGRALLRLESLLPGRDLDFDDFGASIAGLGDLDGDGLGEFAVAAPSFGTPYAFDSTARVGRVYVYSLRIPCEDRDGDGYRTAACGDAETDCDDGDAAVHPGMDELPGNGVDDDCDGAVDEAPIVCGASPGGASAPLSWLPALLLALGTKLRRFRHGSTLPRSSGVGTRQDARLPKSR